MNLSDSFERVYIISLKRNKEKRERLLRQLNEIGFYGAKVFDAIDGMEVGAPGYWSSGDGGWGCLLSHAEIVREAIKDCLSSYLVFEDDAILDSRFEQSLDQFMTDVPKNWDQLYLGGQHFKQPKDLGNGVFQAANINRTHCYALSRTNFARFHSWIMDHSYHGRNKYKQIDHHLGVAHQQNRWKTYAPHRWLVGQGAGFSDVAYMDFVDRWWDYPDHKIHNFLPFVIIENDGSFAHVRGRHNRGKRRKRKGEIAKFLWTGTPLAPNNLSTLAEIDAREHLGDMPIILDLIAKGAFSRRRLPCIYGDSKTIEMAKRGWAGGTVRLSALGGTGEEIRARLEFMCDYPWNGLLNMENRSNLPKAS